MVPGPSRVLLLLCSPNLTLGSTKASVLNDPASQRKANLPPPLCCPGRQAAGMASSCLWTALEQVWCSPDQCDHQARQSHGNPTTKRHNRPNPPGKPKGCGGRHLQCPESRLSGGSTEPQVQDTRPTPNKEIPTSLTRSPPKSQNPTYPLWGGGNLPTTEGCPTNLPILINRSTDKS